MSNNDKVIIDGHVHICSLDESHRCFMSSKMKKSLAIRYLFNKYGLNALNSIEQAEEMIINYFQKEVLSSKHVTKFALLALDDVYNDDGHRIIKHSNYVVSNDYVLNLARRFPEIIPFGSIHPYRTDAIELINEYHLKGIKGIKWLPNLQGIDLNNKKSIRFCEELFKLNIPLLCHLGYEYSLPTVSQKYGNPKSIINCLETGAKIISAHGIGLDIFRTNFSFNSAIGLLKKYPNLFFDLSGMTYPNKLFYLKKFLKHVWLHDRMIFASDYPIPNYPHFLFPFISIRKINELRKVSSIPDRYYLTLRELGLPESIFYNLSKIIDN